MKATIPFCLGSLVLLSLSLSAEANILHDIKKFVTDIFSSDEDAADKPSKTEHVAWKVCRSKNLNLTMLHHTTEECDHEFEVTSKWSKRKKEQLHHSSCYRACQLEHLGWIWANESHVELNIDKAHEYVESIYPQGSIKPIKAGLTRCFHAVDDEAHLSDDEHCKSYRPLLSCIDTVLFEKCKGKGGRNRDRTRGKGNNGNKGKTVKTTTEAAAEEATTAAAAAEDDADAEDETEASSEPSSVTESPTTTEAEAEEE